MGARGLEAHFARASVALHGTELVGDLIELDIEDGDGVVEPLEA
jgi:hypothetical protein